MTELEGTVRTVPTAPLTSQYSVPTLFSDTPITDRDSWDQFELAPPIDYGHWHHPHAEFEHYLNPVMSSAFHVALKLTHDKSSAEEVVQEAALLAFRRFELFSNGSNFKAWFLKIVTNCFLMSVRGKKHRATSLDISEIPEDILSQQADSWECSVEARDPALQITYRKISDQITDSFDSLPLKYRTACVLYFIEEFSYDEIADALKVPVGTVRSRLSRGRRMLQQRLRPLAEEAFSTDD